MKIRHDRTRTSAPKGIFIGVLWYRSKTHWNISIGLIPGFPILLSWRRKVQPVTPVPPEEELPDLPW